VDSTLVDPAKVETNIVGLELSKIGISAADLAARCKDAGLWISALGPHYARLVTHLDFTDVQCDEAIEILKRALVAK
jgi:threonine aldolase